MKQLTFDIKNCPAHINFSAKAGAEPPPLLNNLLDILTTDKLIQQYNIVSTANSVQNINMFLGSKNSIINEKTYAYYIGFALGDVIKYDDIYFSRFASNEFTNGYLQYLDNRNLTFNISVDTNRVAISKTLDACKYTSISDVLVALLDEFNSFISTKYNDVNISIQNGSYAIYCNDFECLCDVASFLTGELILEPEQHTKDTNGDQFLPCLLVKNLPKLQLKMFSKIHRIYLVDEKYAEPIRNGYVLTHVIPKKFKYRGLFVVNSSEKKAAAALIKRLYDNDDIYLSPNSSIVKNGKLPKSHGTIAIAYSDDAIVTALGLCGATEIKKIKLMHVTK